MGYRRFGRKHPDWKTHRPSRDEIEGYIEEHSLPETKAVFRHTRNKLRRRSYRQSLPLGRDISYISSDPDAQVIYGTVRTGGAITCMSISDSDQWLHVVVTVACHEINRITKLFLDDTEVTFAGATIDGWATGPGLYADRVFCRVNEGEDSQTAIGDYISAPDSTPWTTDHRQRGNAHVYMIFSWHGELYGEGLPEIVFEIEGKKVYDPNTASSFFSDNAADCIADYLTNTVYGLSVPQANIDATEWLAAHNECEEAVALVAGGTENRYTVNGWFGASTPHGQVLEDMAGAMAGFITYTEGSWHIRPGMWRAPSISLSETDLRSRMDVGIRTPRSDLFNAVRGTFVDASSNNEVTDFPGYENSTYAAEDGATIWEDLAFVFTTSPTMCQRIARIHLEDVRQMITISATWSLKAFQLEVGDTVSITMDRYGWTDKPFLVESVSLVEMSGKGSRNIGVELELKETAEGIYTWSEDETTHDLSPNTTLPDPWTVEAITTLAASSGTAYLDVRLDGTIFSRVYLSWDAVTSYFISSGGLIEIQYKKSTASVWQNITSQPGDTTWVYILDVADGVDYDFRVRAVNALGVSGDWATVDDHTVLGKTEVPSTITDLTASIENYTVKLTWSEISDLDRSEYEIRTADSTWGTANSTLIAVVKTTTYYWTEPPSGTVTVYIKAKDTTGNYSTTADSAVVTVVSPGAVTNLRGWQTDNNVLIDWEIPTSGTLLIDHYKIYKGDVFASAAYLGEKRGTFYTYIELISGTYTYWIVPIDIAGNVGTEDSIAVFVYNPPDYVLRYNQSLDGSDLTDSSNAYVDDNTGYTYFPVDITETWQEHFVDNSAADFQDMIDAGYTAYAEPTPSTAYVEWKVDFGAVLTQSIISFSTQSITAPGGLWGTLLHNLQYSQDDIIWTDLGAVTDAYASSFRYAKFRTTISSNNGPPVYYPYIVARVTVKKRKDGGIVVVTGNDQEIEFNETFIDVITLEVSMHGTSAKVVVADFTDSPNPTSFTVQVYDTDGNETTGTISWSADGIIDGSAEE